MRSLNENEMRRVEGGLVPVPYPVYAAYAAAAFFGSIAFAASRLAFLAFRPVIVIW